MNESVYRVRFLSNGVTYRKGAWVLHRDVFTTLEVACEKARRSSACDPCQRRWRVTQDASVKPLAEFLNGQQV